MWQVDGPQDGEADPKMAKLSGLSSPLQTEINKALKRSQAAEDGEAGAKGNTSLPSKAASSKGGDKTKCSTKRQVTTAAAAIPPAKADGAAEAAPTEAAPPAAVPTKAVAAEAVAANAGAAHTSSSSKAAAPCSNIVNGAANSSKELTTSAQAKAERPMDAEGEPEHKKCQAYYIVYHELS